jgi:hypothetical protein
MRREKETAAVGFFNFFMVFLFVLGRVILAQKPGVGSLYLWLYWLDPFVWNYNQLKICLDNSCLSATLPTSRRAWSKTDCLLDRRGKRNRGEKKKKEK